MRRPERQGNADLPSGTRDARLTRPSLRDIARVIGPGDQIVSGTVKKAVICSPVAARSDSSKEGEN
jgi:hypothetical protein